MGDVKKLADRLRYVAEFMEDHGIGVGDHCDAPTLVEAAGELERLAADRDRLLVFVDGIARHAIDPEEKARATDFLKGREADILAARRRVADSIPPLTPEEAERAYAEAEPVPMTKSEIQRIVDRATGKHD